MNNELEWEVITDPEKLFHLYKAGWEIEVNAGTSWSSWNGTAWHKDWGEYRTRPPKPKMKQVKLLAYLGGNFLNHVREDAKETLPSHWIRQPHLDLIAEVPE